MDNENNNPSGESGSNPVEDEPSDTPDLGLGNIANNRTGEAAGTSRREENPFSFKKFLNQDHGTRRKDYHVEGGSAYHHGPMLPDFVQDHMIMEQSYMSGSPPHASIPFDLPLAAADDRHDPPVPLGLPDFLSDGPIRNQLIDVDQGSDRLGPSNGHLSPAVSNRDDLDQMQRELDALRRQIREKNQRIQRLESDVSLLRSRDARNAQPLEETMQKVETELEETSRRLLSAEVCVQKLKLENIDLKNQLAARHGEASRGSSISIPVDTQRIVSDLKSSSASAEVHLRALLSGIENIKSLAVSLEESMKSHSVSSSSNT